MSSIQVISGIETIVAGAKKAKTAVVILHGYGANMHDLYPLWEMWDEQGDLSWYFPNGVLALPMGFYEGRSWFSIDVAALEEAMRTGKERDLSQKIPPEFEASIKQLEFFLRTLAQEHESIILGGFSQGAMCTLHLGMLSDLPLAGLIFLSGNLIAEGKLPASARGLPFYQSHGNRDTILSFNGAKKLEEKLKSLNFVGSLHEFSGGHEIPLNVIQGVRNFIRSLA